MAQRLGVMDTNGHKWTHVCNHQVMASTRELPKPRISTPFPWPVECFWPKFERVYVGLLDLDARCRKEHCLIQCFFGSSDCQSFRTCWSFGTVLITCMLFCILGFRRHDLKGSKSSETSGRLCILSRSFRISGPFLDEEKVSEGATGSEAFFDDRLLVR